MMCWHCDSELRFECQTTDELKFYNCPVCDTWYEMRKEKERINGAVPVRFLELETRPQYAAAT